MAVNSGSAGRSIGVLGALSAMIAWGASGVLAKAIDLGGLAVVVYRFWLSTVVFLAYLGVRALRGNGGLTLAKIRIAIPGGLGLGLDVAFFFSAVKLTTVANATVVVALQPLVLMYIGSRFLGERVHRTQVLWSVVALGGVALLVFGSSGLPGWSLKGDLLAAGALLAWAAYLFFSKSTQGAISPLEYTAATGLIAAVINTPLALAFGQDLSWPSMRDWWLLLLMAFGSGLFAHLVMNWSLTRIPVWLGSTMSLLIPAGATAIAWAALGEEVNLVQIGGIALTLLALVAITRSRTGQAGDDADDHSASIAEAT